MKRGYTVEQYREMRARIRDIVPECAVSSDFIVGFCGETDKDFELTCELVREQRFKNSFIFKYSERPGTKGAERYPDDVPEPVKKNRNNDLLEIQNAISEEDNQPFLGRDVEVLVEGPSKTGAKQDAADPQVQLTGRTLCDRIVVFEGNRRQIGHVLPSTVYDANGHTQVPHIGVLKKSCHLGKIASKSMRLVNFGRVPLVGWTSYYTVL